MLRAIFCLIVVTEGDKDEIETGDTSDRGGKGDQRHSPSKPEIIFRGGKVRIAPDGLHGEDTFAELCRREGIVQSIYYRDLCIRSDMG